MTPEVADARATGFFDGFFIGFFIAAILVSAAFLVHSPPLSSADEDSAMIHAAEGS